MQLQAIEKKLYLYLNPLPGKISRNGIQNVEYTCIQITVVVIHIIIFVVIIIVIVILSPISN